MSVDMPLDLIAPVSHGEAVAAFVGATLGEQITTTVQMAAGELRQLDTFNLRDRLGCLLLVLCAGSP